MSDQPPAAKRGVLYVTWGPMGTFLQRSVNSVRAIHPELPVHIHKLPDNASLLDKASLFHWTPFEETLFLDADTIVLDRLDFGFEMAVKHGLACCICENPWARRYAGIKGDLVEYNTGVQFFTRRAKPFFDAWADNVRKVDSSIRFYRDGQLLTMPFNDQAGYSLAIAQSPVPPFILPLNWNFRPQWHRAWWGPVKIWHDYSEPPPDFIKFIRAQAQPDAITQFVQFKP